MLQVNDTVEHLAFHLTGVVIESDDKVFTVQWSDGSISKCLQDYKAVIKV